MNDPIKPFVIHQREHTSLPGWWAYQLPTCWLQLPIPSVFMTSRDGKMDEKHSHLCQTRAGGGIKCWEETKSDGGWIKLGRRRNSALEKRDRQRGCRKAMLVPFLGEPVETAARARLCKTGQRRRIRRWNEATREGGEEVKEGKKRHAGRQGKVAEAQAMQDAQSQDETRDTERNHLDWRQQETNGHQEKGEQKGRRKP